MRPPSCLRPARRGFTLVELLVACALVVIICTVLAVAFSETSKAFRDMKAVGDLAEDLRNAGNAMRADLNAEHFSLTEDSPAHLRTGDLWYNRTSPATAQGRRTTPPAGGYFRVLQGSGSVYEGADVDGDLSTRSTTDELELTVHRRGRSPDDLFTIRSPLLYNQRHSVSDTAGPDQFCTHWARVRWYLGNPQVRGAGEPTTYTLYRSVRLLVPTAAARTQVVEADAAEQLSTAAVAGPHRMLNEVDDPNNRQAITPFGPAAANYGNDIAVIGVTSFSVKATWEPLSGGPRGPRATLPNPGIGNAIPDTTNPPPPPGVGQPANIANTHFPFDDLPVQTANPSLAGQRVFDTWSELPGWNAAGTNNSMPLRVRVTAVRITLRLWDTNLQKTRQVTVIQDL